MKRGILARALRRSKTPAPGLREALEQLDELARQRGSLVQPIALLREVLPAIYLPPPPLATVTLTESAALEKLRQGTPLLRDEPLSVDEDQFRPRWRKVCIAVGRNQSAPAPVRKLAKLLDRPGWSIDQLVAGVLAGNVDDIRSRAQTAGLDPELTATVLRLTLLPTLSHIAASMASWHRAVRWAHGYCPVCGSWPLLAEFRGLEQLRFLRCGLCAAEWEFPRLQCPFCSTRDHKLLGYFHVEGEEAKYRVATCDGCRHYVKLASTLAALSGAQLLVMDLATMHLDLVAIDQRWLERGALLGC